jgi:hypothetical protein
MFVVNLAAPHYCLVFLSIPEVTPQTISVRLADFNRRSYGQDSLRVSGELWETGLYLVYIQTHKTVSIARGYLDDLRNSRYVFGQVPKEFYQAMIISSENFQTLMNLRNLEVYKYFYEINYNP